MLKRIFGSRNDRILRSLNKDVKAINALEPDMQALSEADLKAKTQEFRARLEAGEALDKLLHEAFAVVREAGWRVLGTRRTRCGARACLSAPRRSDLC